MAKFERKSYICGVFFLYKLIIDFRDLRNQKSPFLANFYDFLKMREQLWRLFWHVHWVFFQKSSYPDLWISHVKFVFIQPIGNPFRFEMKSDVFAFRKNSTFFANFNISAEV